MEKTISGPARAGREPRADMPAAVETGLATLGLVAGILAALVASCCFLPLALAMAGVGGSWIGAFVPLAEYRGVIIVAGAAFVGSGWIVFARRRRRPCHAGGRGASAKGTLMIAVLCLATLSAAGAVILAWFEPELLRFLYAHGGAS